MDPWAALDLNPPDFGVHHHCTKCGGKARYQYCERTPPRLTGATITCAEPELPALEHLHCTCTLCGYTWIEKTADASGKKFTLNERIDRQRQMGV